MNWREIINSRQISALGSRVTTQANDSVRLRHLRYKDMFGSNLISFFPLNDVSSTTAYDFSGNGRNGAYVGTPARAVSPFEDGESVPVFTGNSTLANIHTAGLAGAFSGAEGAVFFDVYADPDDWADGSTRYLFMIYADDNNRIFARKDGDGALSFIHVAGSTTKSISISHNAAADFAFSLSSPVRFCLTWSVSTSTILYLYVDGVPWTYVTAIGTFSGTPSVMAIGDQAATATPSGWKGNIANFGIVSRYLQTWECRRLIDAANYKVPILSVIGDSIANDATDWPVKLLDYYNEGRFFTRSHAVAGNSIVSHMATQVTAAISDRAGIVIFALGTNDDNSGDMEALQAVVETQIGRMQACMPFAKMYYMNVLPVWTDTGGDTPVDKSNIRAAIAAACAAKGITCWDTFTDPWIAASDTSDGLHPTAAGSIKVAQKIASLL